jgi:hypothetical protein
LSVLILTNVKLKHAIIIIVLNVSSFSLTLFLGFNPMMYISHIPPLDGSNYRVWREKYELALALSENDLALTSPCPTEPVEPVRAENETDTDFTVATRSCRSENEI